MDKKRSVFNKKKWLRNYLEEILRLKKQGSTHQAIIQHLTEQQNMPFDLSESLLSRYLKEFAEDESTYKKVNDNLHNRIEQKNDRLAEKNHEIQNLKRRLERTLERNLHLDVENECLKDRNRILENKFLDGEARLKDLRRYNGYNNVHWKVADLTEKNDEMFQSILMLERLSERLAKPHEEADEKIRQLESEISQIKGEYEQLEQNQLLSNQKVKQLEQTINALKNEKQALEKQLAERETPVIHQDQEKIEQLTQERQKFLQERNQLHMLSKRLKSDLSNSEHQLREISHLLYESRNNAKQKDLWRILALSFGCLAIIFLLMFIFL